MTSGQPEQKRPRLSTNPTWSGGQLPAPPLQHPSNVHHPPLHSYQPHHPFSRPAEHPPNPVHHHHEDRRHHDQDPYTPIQEQHRRPPLSPAHPPPYPQYSPTDPAVKRDPAAEETSLPQLRRPNSTGNAPLDGHSHPPPPPAHGPPLPSHHLDDQRRPMSYDNGQSMPPSPALYRPQHAGFPPPGPATPMAQHHPQYEAPPHGYAPPPAQEIFAPMPITNAKRKSQRASQACDSCRVLKAKCDETKPCKNCKDKNIPCVYREQTAKQTDKVSSDLLDMMTAMRDQISKEFGKFDVQFNSLTTRITAIETKLEISSQPGEDVKVESIEQDSDEMDLNGNDEPKGLEDLDEAPGEDDMDDSQAPAPPILTGDEMERNPGPPVFPDKPSIPANHTTLASFLLGWKSVDELVRPLLKQENINHIEHFPILKEAQRGLLRVFGKGEGVDKDIRAPHRDGQTPIGPTITDLDDASEAASPAPYGDSWGQVATILPTGHEHKGGVLNSDGIPDFSKEKVSIYVDSFKQNILNMHPILIPKELDDMVNIFLESLPKKSSAKQPANKVAKFVVSKEASSVPSTPSVETGMKRKRSPAADEQSPSAPFQRPGLPFRSIHSALILLVLALGKICLHKGKIPDVVRDQEHPSTNSPLVRNGVPTSPLQGSPPRVNNQPQLSGLPSPKESERTLPGRRPSLTGGVPGNKASRSMKRNMDVIPGLEYFALATDIIGSHLGGHNLKHVYVLLLAGLYHGQLGRVIESWSYINRASVSMQVILRPRHDRLKRNMENLQVITEKSDNQLAFAFWTCLQLESDILAELPLPQSGILAYENQMPFPNIAREPKNMTEGYDERTTASYVGQLYLRKHLNRIHEELYDPAPSTSHRTTEEKVKEIQNVLTKGGLSPPWPEWIPPGFQFTERDPPADDILSARLRAKYWGSQVILYRPFVRMILNYEVQPPDMFRTPPPPVEEWAHYGINYDAANIAPDIDPRAMTYARLGVLALVQSTKAFHGMNETERIIVTNHFTTAHAQWGNLLILAACHQHPILSKFVDAHELQGLFRKTILFFDLIATPTSPLQADKNILIGLAERIGLTAPKLGIREPDTQPNSSFSSASSSAPPPVPNVAAYSPGGYMPPPHQY